MPKEISELDFEQAVIETSKTKPVLVDFYATWCPPCKMLAPVIERIATELGDKLEVVKVNTDESPNLATQFGISAVPTMVVFKDGKQEKIMVGFRDYHSLKHELETLL